MTEPNPPLESAPRWRRELQILLTAVAFLTRIPVPQLLPYRDDYLVASARYFPLVGVLVGALAAAVFVLAGLLWPLPVAVLLSMAGSIWLTGAFHEDGFADCCDGFGGGWEKQQVLTIMKDSRLGTYGTVGLLLVLAIKYAALSELAVESVVVALLLAHGVSRLLAVSYLWDLPYVRDIDQSKAKPLANSMSTRNLALAALSLLPLLLAILYWLPASSLLLLVASLLLFRHCFKRYQIRRLGGYTGDCLGMAQQFAELLIYLSLLAAL